MPISIEQYDQELPELANVISKCPQVSHVTILNSTLTAIMSSPSMVLKIEYHHIYSEPSLYFRFTRTTSIDGFETQEVVFPENVYQQLLSSAKRFTIQPEPTDDGVWYLIHPCSTALHIQPESPILYLVQWFYCYGQAAVVLRSDYIT